MVEDYSEFEGPDALLNRITYAVIGAAMEVHRELGPGHIEAVYERALAIEFRRRGIRFEQQYAYAVKYQGEWVGDGRVDFLVEDRTSSSSRRSRNSTPSTPSRWCRTSRR